MTPSISVQLTNQNILKSRLFGVSEIKHSLDTLVLMIDLSELPKDIFIMQEGYLFIYMNEKKKRCSIFYEKEMTNRHFIKGGYPISFEMCDPDSDSFKLLGRPYGLNYHASKDEFLLVQFDPYIMEDIPLFSSLDGYVYVLMKESDYINKTFDNVYLVIDRT